MAKTASTMTPLGTRAPGFTLPDTEGKLVSLDDFDGKPALLVVFMCNHCPFVIHVQQELAALARDYQARGLAMVGINANDAQRYPADSPAKMAEDVARLGYDFPYLFDETQQTAKDYQAACTPDFFLFDRERRLVYRGQLDDSRPSNDIPVTGRDLRAAVDAVLAGKKVAEAQKPSIGCSLKWRPGNEP